MLKKKTKMAYSHVVYIALKRQLDFFVKVRAANARFKIKYII